MIQGNRWFYLLLLWPLLCGLPLSAGNVVFDFEGPARVWRGDAITAGPWLQKEWRALGSQALKADIELRDEAAYYLNTRDFSDLRKYAWITAIVTRSWWGNFGGEFMARLYVKTGENWQWYEGVTVPVAQPFGSFYYTHNTVVDFDLSQVKNLDQVREIGVQFYSKGNNSGSAAIYLDQLTLFEKRAQQIFPRWVRATAPLNDGFGRYFTLENKGLGQLDIVSGHLKWSRSFDRPVRFYLPHVSRQEPIYAVGEGIVWSIDRDTGAVNWQKPLRSGLYANVISDSDGSIYLSTSGIDTSIIALNKLDGSLLWQASGVQPASLSMVTTEGASELLSRDNRLLVQARDPMTEQLIMIGLNRSTGQRVWEYREAPSSYVDLFVHPQGQLIVRTSGPTSHVGALDLQTGKLLWDYSQGTALSIEMGIQLENVLLLRGSYDAPGLFALDSRTGQLLWTFQQGDFFSVTRDASGLPYVMSFAANLQTLIALDRNGQERWRQSYSGYASLQKNGIFYTESLGDKTRLIMLDPNNGQPLWSYTSTERNIAIPTDDSDLAILDGRELKAIDPATGQMLWKTALNAGANVMQFDDTHYYILEPTANFGSSDILAIRKKTGLLSWRYTPGYTVSGLQLGYQKATTAGDLLLLQYQVGSKYPIGQGVIALPR